MSDSKKAKLVSIQVITETDCDPDTSWIGEYTSKPGQDDRTIDREARGDMGLHEYRYFVAAMGPDETGNPESVEADYRRMESLSRGDWGFVGIRAVAKLSVNGTLQTVTSGGLWGIESDSGKDYFKEVEKEQIDELRATLAELGVSGAEFDSVSVERVAA